MLLVAQDNISALPHDSNTLFEERSRPSISLEPRENPAQVVMADKKTFRGVTRRTFGILLLLATVFLWTVGNFLTSVCRSICSNNFPILTYHIQTIFADDSYSKPYFVTYMNTSAFTIFLVSTLSRRLWASRGSPKRIIEQRDGYGRYGSIAGHEQEAFLKPSVRRHIHIARASLSETLSPDIGMASHRIYLGVTSESGLDMRATAKLSLEFCLLWVSVRFPSIML